MIVRKQKGGDRRYRRDLIAFYSEESQETIPFDMNDSSREQIHKLRDLLDRANTGNISLAFKDKTGDKQITINDRGRLYLKIKKMKILKGDEKLYDDLWSQTFVNAPPANHHFILILLCVKGIFKGGDLELPLLSLGIAIENETEARISTPDRVFRIFDQYTGRIGDASINSEKTDKLDLSESDKLTSFAELLIHHSDMNLNSYEEFGRIVNSSSDFSEFVYSLFTNSKGLSLSDSLRKKKSKLGELLLREYEYFKDHKPVIDNPVIDKPETPDPEPETPDTPLSQTSSRTEVGHPSPYISSDEDITPLEELEGCLRDNPCLKLIYDELKGENKGAITKKTKRKKRKKRKKSSKKKRKKSLKDKIKKKRRTNRLSKKKTRNRKR